MNKKVHAFTLAEVLITLGIIDVVAALTMPTLIANYKDKALETQVAKAKTTLANGYKLMMARIDTFNIENLPLLTECNALTDVACMSKYHKDAFSIASDTPTLSSDIMPEEYDIRGSEDKSPFKWSEVDYMFMTGDGVVYGVIPGETSSTFDIVADINGSKKPNVAVQDLRKFRLSGDGGNLYDVSEELTEIPGCSLSNLTACTTESDCEGIGGQWCLSNGSGSPYECRHPSDGRMCPVQGSW